jgi:transposase
MTVGGTVLSSPRISELLGNLGERDRDRMSFFKAWSRKRAEQECIAFDITSVSSYSKLNEFLEFGYNRDGEDLPQINMAMLFGETSLLPVFYSTVQGSIRDMSTVENMMKYAKELDITHVRFVMDKGFYSESNLREMGENRLKYAVSVPFTTALAKASVDEMRKQLASPSQAFGINGDIVQGICRKRKIHGRRGYLFVYFNERQRLDWKEGLMKRILRLEHRIEGKRRLPAGLEDPCLKYLKVRESRNGLLVRRDEEEIMRTLKYKGFMVMLSNNVKDAKECLHLYRSKDAVERAFDNMKNELDLKRLRIHSEISMHGRTFVAFIGLILHSWIDRVMKEKGLYKRYTQEEVIAELKRLKIIELSGGRKTVTEVSKNQATIFKAFGISKPEVALL